MIEFFERFVRKDPHVVIGLMSGTSADGIDAAAVEISGGKRKPLKVHVLGEFTLPFEPDLRRAVLDVCAKDGGSSAELCKLNAKLGEAFAEAALGLIQSAGLAQDAVDLIGSHGQTIAHYPPSAGADSGATLQIGEAAIIAERTGITTVSNFRARDMAAGGQGAPLVPLADWLLFSSPSAHRAALNIGGIANVTWLPAGGAAESVIAFDTGPGNMVLDALAERFTQGAQHFDENGAFAAEGRIDSEFLEELLAHDYFHRPPPKTTGREEFGAAFTATVIEAGEARGLSPHDIMATLTALTAESIVAGLNLLTHASPHSQSVLAPLPELPRELIVAGGGALNPILMALVRHRLPGWRVTTSAEFDVPVKMRECVAFAILARETLLGRPGNLPSATGARGPRVLGDITPGKM